MLIIRIPKMKSMKRKSHEHQNPQQGGVVNELTLLSSIPKGIAFDSNKSISNYLGHAKFKQKHIRYFCALSSNFCANLSRKNKKSFASLI